MLIDPGNCELPMAVADSVYELSQLTGYSQSAISHGIHSSKVKKFIKVKKDEKGTTDYDLYDSSDLDIEHECKCERTED